MRPSVRDRGRDGTVVRAREHRVVLVELVSCERPRGGRWEGGVGGIEGVRGG